MLSQDFQPLEWAHAALAADTIGRAWAEAESALTRFGFENLTFVFDHPLGDRAAPPDTQKFGSILNRDWERRLRTDPEIIVNDPVSRRFLSRDRPVPLWRDSPLFRSFTGAERRFFRNYERYGYKAGCIWPSHDRKRGATHVLLTWTEAERPDYRDALTHYSEAAHLALTYFCEALRVKRIRRAAAGPVLSPRERECLLWVQAGKSSKEIGERLAISDATVNEHILHACRKLEAANRAQAAARAVMLDLIRP